MIFSIIIPTFENYRYLSLCVDSIFKNSIYNHEIIIHLNGYDKNSKKLILEKKLLFTESKKNIGLCSGVNLASKKATNSYILYAHDDMYFLPKWDKYLKDEIESIKHNKFYLSLTQISHTGAVKGNIQHIQFDCGNTIDNFNEEKLLNKFEDYEFKDLQGSHWAPHIIHKSMWEKVGGFSKEFDPGFASDPDLNMKMWKEGVRIFKGVSKSRVYHFSSLTTRKSDKIIRNNGKKTFLLKWGITIEFFVKHFLKRGTKYSGPLDEPEKNIVYFFDYMVAKIKFYIKNLLK